MNKDETCKRIMLAGTDGCKIIYCEACNIAEMELGAISVRLELMPSTIYRLYLPRLP
jgi:hypothetical protein